MRVVLIAETVGPVGRRVPWTALAATSLICAAIVWWRALRVDAAGDLAPVVRLSAVLLAAAAAACLEDGSEELAATSAVGRLARRTIAMAITATATIGAFAVIATVADLLVGGQPSSSGLPVTRVLVELAALIACGALLATAFIAWRGWRGVGARAAFSLCIVSTCVAGHPLLAAWLWNPPAPDSGWSVAHARWSVIGLCAAVATGVLSRDPAGRPITRHAR